MNSSKTFRYSAMGPSPQSSNVPLFKPLMNLNLLKLES